MPLQASPLWRLKHRNSPKLLCNELSCEEFMHLSIFHHVFYLLVRYLTLVSLPVCHAMFTLGLSIFSYYQHITGVVKEAKSKTEMLTDLWLLWLSVRHYTIWQNITNTREVTYYIQRSLQNIISMVLWLHSTTHRASVKFWMQKKANTCSIFVALLPVWTEVRWRKPAAAEHTAFNYS